MKVIKDVKGAPAPVGAYSPAIEHLGLVFSAGQIGLDPETGKLVDGGVEAETRQVLSNLKAVLNAANSAPELVLMATVFLSDIALAPQVNKLYSEFVSTDAPPARQTVAVKALPLGAQVEISVIAAVR